MAEGQALEEFGFGFGFGCGEHERERELIGFGFEFDKLKVISHSTKWSDAWGGGFNLQ